MNRFIAPLVVLVSLVLGAQVSAQQLLSQSITHQGMQRDYLIYIPATYDASQAVPLLFNFHGYTSTASAQLATSDMRPIADTANFLLVYPQGALFGNSTHWNVGSWTLGSTVDDLGFVDDLIDTLAAAYNLDLERVYACGFSNGGFFSFALACGLSARIAAVASVAATMTQETTQSCQPVHPTAILTMHGTADVLVRYTGGFPPNVSSVNQVINYWSSYNNTNPSPSQVNLPDLDPNDGSTVEKVVYSQGDSCTTVEHYRIVNGGHSWPGNTGNMDIDANTIIWNFLSQYSLNGRIECDQSLSQMQPGRMQNKLAVYPNPGKGLFQVEIAAEDLPLAYQLYSPQGQLLQSGHFAQREDRLELPVDAAGLYLLRTALGVHRLLVVND